MKKLFKIVLCTVPIVLMIGLIPYILNDYLLTAIYMMIIFVSLQFFRRRNDLLILTFGFFVMTASEYFFISTGVETFSRRTLLGVMPLWLPFLWAYGFVAIKHSIEILNKTKTSYGHKKNHKFH